jgi:hypothetical protein
MSKNTLDSLFGTNKKKANQGVRIVVGYNDKEEEVAFWIAKVNNPKHQAAQRKYAKMLETTRNTPKRHEAVLAKVIAEGILLKWEGVYENGKPMEPTADNKAKMLVKHDDLFQEVMTQSMDKSNFMVEDDMTDEEGEKDTSGN